MSPEQKLNILDASSLPYNEKVCAVIAQGIINRNGPKLFLDFGIYDDLDARRTNEIFMDDAIWYGKYRDILGNQDLHNLEYYQNEHHFEVQKINDLQSVINDYSTLFKGYIIWDDQLPDTVNVALMLAAQENLLVINSAMEEWVKQFALPLAHDLRGKWKSRITLYQWAFQTLFAKCKKGVVACVEPEWNRPEFLDYLAQNKIFTYNLASSSKGLGSTLLLLLAFGPAKLREAIFALQLDHLIRKFGLAWMGWKSAEVRLSNRIQSSVEALPYPTIFGWHTRRDNELSFMLQLSSNGLRLVPAHLAGNFSFHSQVKPKQAFKPDPLPKTELDPEGIYITFTLSDGDQLMMMNTSELGNWHSLKRGSVAFNWETQPLLIEIAPALYERYFRTKTNCDCLIAGPSGAGYIVPPLAPKLTSYMKATAEVCQQAGIQVVTTYVADPPMRTMKQLAKHKGKLLGFLSGYAIVERSPQICIDGTVILANEIPMAANIWDTSDQLLDKLVEKINSPGILPRFMGVHLFAYRTTFEDIVNFVANIESKHVHIVRADEFLLAAEQHLKSR